LVNESAGPNEEEHLENDLIFATEISDGPFDADRDAIQVAAATTETPSAALPETPIEAAQVVVPQGAQVVHVTVAPGEVVELPFGPEAHFLGRIGDGNLAIKVGDVVVILEGYVAAAGHNNPPVIETADGEPLDIASLLAATDPNVEIQTAAGPGGNAGGQGADNTGGIFQQFGAGEGGLGGFTGAGGQGSSEGPAAGAGVDQTGTLFRQFGSVTGPSAPIAPDLKFTTDEDSKLAGKLVATDADGDTLKYSVVGATPPGVTFHSDGTWSFNPTGLFDQLNVNESDTVSFQYKANDGIADSNVATATIEVTGVNDAPKFTGGVTGLAFPEDEPNHDFKLDWSVEDPDDTTFTITADKSTLPTGVTFDSDTKTIHFDTFGQYDYLKEGESAAFVIKFTITDAHGGSVEQDFNLTIAGEKETPVAVADTVLSCLGIDNNIDLPEWALLANDKGFGENLDVAVVGDPMGGGYAYYANPGVNGYVAFSDIDELGGSFSYTATNGSEESAKAGVTIHNQETGTDITGTDADEILVGSAYPEKLDGGGGDDIIFGGRGKGSIDEIYGGAGDDILQFTSNGTLDGGTDNVAESGGLAGAAENHGDRLLVYENRNFADSTTVAHVHGVETISTQEKLGGVNNETVTIGAASVRQLSDHTITPGGGFGEHDAIRFDGDTADQVYLSISHDGGKWVDTGIEQAGYRIYAHETTGGDPATADAYVMVQAANIGNVHLNRDDAPVAVADRVLSTDAIVDIPEWALLFNDREAGKSDIDVTDVGNAIGGSAIYSPDPGVNGSVDFVEDVLGGSFTYKATDGNEQSSDALVTVETVLANSLTGTAADEIFVGTSANEKFDGGGGNDVILGGQYATDEIFGGAGDDLLAVQSATSKFDGGTDNVATSGGLGADAANHGDILALNADFNLADSADAANIKGIETISAEDNVGGLDEQFLTISAASVRQLSDHTITPGGGFGEHDAVRFDGGHSDRIYLSVSKDGGQWVDTGIEQAGYRIYAHETTSGNPATADAYVMVQADAQAVHLNQDAPAVGDDLLLTNNGLDSTFDVPDWVFTANDQNVKAEVTGLTYDSNEVEVHFDAAQLAITDRGALGGTFEYNAATEDGSSKFGTVTMKNQDAGPIFGTDADEILVGTTNGSTIDGGGGNDIILGRIVGAVFFAPNIYGGAGDDIISIDLDANIHGGVDSVATSGGLASSEAHHGDVLVQTTSFNLADSGPVAASDGIETISTLEKFGGTGTQLATIGAGAVRQLSDHTITPGGSFGEHEAIRIDGDAVDQLYLSVSKDGGAWIDTGTEVAGYHVYAHVTGAEKDPATTDAYVMVQAANTGNVHLNEDGVPAPSADTVLANVGDSQGVVIPEWALLANDKSPGGTPLDVASVSDAIGSGGLTHTAGSGSNGSVTFIDDVTLGGSFAYTATDGSIESSATLVTVRNQVGDTIIGTSADEILVGTKSSLELDGGAGNDIILGGDGAEIMGGAGDDTIVFSSIYNGYGGGTDSVAPSGGLAATADSHGDVLATARDLDIADLVIYGRTTGIETISTEAKFGAAGAQTLAISAEGVRQVSDHTVTPGGAFGEHDAVRIDGDAVDQLYLSVGREGGQWVDTGIEKAGYRIFAHETTGGDSATADAYVMVQAANAGQVHLNRDAPTAFADRVLTTAGSSDISIPEWALLANDKGSNLDVDNIHILNGLSGFSHDPGTGSNGTVVLDDATSGGTFIYTATDGSTQSEYASVSIQNLGGTGQITGTSADEILVGTSSSEKLDGGGGNDIIFGNGGTLFGSDTIFGGSGDDIIVADDLSASIHGGADNLAASGGLGAIVDSHGDVLVQAFSANLADAAQFGSIDGIETLSTETKFGATGAQTLIVGAGTVQQFSDHTITPGGLFGEHDAIRIDGDIVDLLYLSISKDGGKWVDTGVETVGYHIYAHETGGDAASTDAYVMVQSANAGNVHLNQDGLPVAVADTVLANNGANVTIFIPEWALLANDKSGDRAALDVGSVYNPTSATDIIHNVGKESNGNILFDDDASLGGTFTYTNFDNGLVSAQALVTIQNQSGGDITGTAADEIILEYKNGSEKLDGGGGNDIIFGHSGGGGHQEIFGGAGDDLITPVPSQNSAHGGTDNVAASGGLASSAGSHGDVLIIEEDLDLADSADASKLEGFETISSQAKFGSTGSQNLTIGAGSVQQLSDHAITPGGLFGEHGAIRIDGDTVDQLYLSISKDGGKWVDTSIEAAGYHIFAHEVAGGDADSTDAYVMVQTANTGNVHLNHDAP
jgi:hypothetical protein